MIGLPEIYVLAGAMFAAFALLSARDRALWNAGFWGLVALSFLAGDRIGDTGNGALLLALVALAASGRLRRSDPPTTTPEQRAAEAERRRDRLFLPALLIPAGALATTLLLRHSPLVDPRQVTLVGLALGVLLALGVACAWLRPPPLAPLQEGRRMMDAVGWAAILPQALASLGALFAVAGVGPVIGGLLGGALPQGSPLLATLAFTIGMAAFTGVMGNAFAAFPVMMAAIGLPLLVGHYHGDPAPIAAIGMLSGFCGTLLTPMAANYNLVPAALLNLERNAVIRVQAGTALPLLAVNTALIGWFAFPGVPGR